MRAGNNVILFKKIREENLKKYGTDFERIAKHLLQDRYRDRTHFIYELLQNTEDAYARKSQKDTGVDCPIKFDLFPDALVVRHYGIPFSENDVKSISGVLLSEKKDGQIGRFGIGFKSVFAFTDTPIIHSGPWHFRIEKFVYPYDEESADDIEPKETKIIIPFNKENIDQKIFFSEISKKLRNLGNQTLLFISHINRIEWHIHSEKELHGEYRKRTEVYGHGELVTLDVLRSNGRDLSPVVPVGKRKGIKVNITDPSYLEPVRAIDKEGKETDEYVKGRDGKEILHSILWKYKSRNDMLPETSVVYTRGNGQQIIKEVPSEGYFWGFSVGGKELELFRSPELDEGEKNSSHSSQWLVYSRAAFFKEKDIGNVSVAFSVIQNKREVFAIEPVLSSNLVVFFPTSQLTGLKFIIHGPFNTTPSRDMIKEGDALNDELIEIFSLLLADTINNVKKDGLYNLNFLKILPTNTDEYFEERIWDAAYEATKRILSKNKLLPAEGGNYTNVKDGKIASNEQLRELLSAKQLSILTGEKDACWLDGKISSSEFHSLRKYFEEELEVKKYTTEDFVDDYTVDFAQSQTDKWTSEFYGFLAEYPHLYTYEKSEPGPFRYRPIIRLHDGTHCPPFDQNDNPLVFLPSKGAQNNGFRVIKNSLMDFYGAKHFFNSLGLRKPEKKDVVLSLIQKYQLRPSDITEEENKQDLRSILDALREDLTPAEISEVISKISSVDFIIARNLSDGEDYFRSPCDVLIGERFTQDSTLDKLFDCCESAFFLSNCYVNDFDASRDIPQLIRLGCRTVTTLIKRRESSDGKIVCVDEKKMHIRGIDGFDPETNIPHIEDVMEIMDINKAVTLWNFLLKQPEPWKLIQGEVEKSKWKDYRAPERLTYLSSLGNALVDNQWIPSRDGRLCRPNSLKVDNLYKSLDIDSDGARGIINALGIQDSRVHKKATIIGDSVKSKFPLHLRKLLEMAEEMSAMDDAEAMELCKKMIQIREGALKPLAHRSAKEIIAGVKDKADESIGKGITPGKNPSVGSYSPEETDEIINAHADRIEDIVKNQRVIERLTVAKKSEVIDRNGKVIEPRSFLYEQYGGMCQICTNSLELGEGKEPHFRTFHIIDGEGNQPGIDLACNILSLCPNCWAQLKYGSPNISDLSRVIDLAAKNDAPVENIPSANYGAYVTVNITMAGKRKKIHYTPEHIRKAAVEIETSMIGDSVKDEDSSNNGSSRRRNRRRRNRQV